MTVTLVTQPASMHAFKNSDLDEVHSLSRYCFSYSSLGGSHLLFQSCCSQIMYTGNLASIQGYQARKTVSNSTQGYVPELFLWISKDLDISMDDHDNKPLDSS